MASVFCARCGRALVPGGAFCPNCGAAQRFPPPPANAGTSFIPTSPLGSGNKSDTGLAVVIVAVAVVAFLIVVSFVWVLSVETTRISTFPPDVPLGSTFAVGNAIEGTCPTGSTFEANGCSAGDFQYTVTVENSVVTFGDVAFQVVTSTGSVLTVIGGLGFTILNDSGVALAQFAVSGGHMSMGSPSWTYSSGTASSTPLREYDIIVIDMGTTNPVGLGFYFEANGVGRYTGWTGTSLP